MVARVVRVPRTYATATATAPGLEDVRLTAADEDEDWDEPAPFEFEFAFASASEVVSRANPSNAHVAEASVAAGANPAPRSSTRSDREDARISAGTVASRHARVAKRGRDAGSSSAGRAMRRGVGEGSSSSSAAAAGAGAGAWAGAGSRHATVMVNAPASSAPARASGSGPPRGGNAHVTTVGSSWSTRAGDAWAGWWSSTPPSASRARCQNWSSRVALPSGTTREIPVSSNAHASAVSSTSAKRHSTSRAPRGSATSSVTRAAGADSAHPVVSTRVTPRASPTAARFPPTSTRSSPATTLAPSARIEATSAVATIPRARRDARIVARSRVPAPSGARLVKCRARSNIVT